MPSKSKKAQKPEDMLIRLIRVAEILAKGQNQSTQVSSVTTPSSDAGIHLSAIPAQKTQE
jgi:hypothetical protein